MQPNSVSSGRCVHCGMKDGHLRGQEWLARFEKELDNEWLNHLDIQHKETILEAARRAAGLSDE